jgi:nitroreductase
MYFTKQGHFLSQGLEALFLMETLESMHTRQSIGQVRPDPVPRELIEKILAAGAQAPNHHKVRPWRFVVLSGPARDRLGRVRASSLQAEKPGIEEAALTAERAKFLRAPVLIAVGVDRPAEPRVSQVENICAAAAAAQNMLLAAQALGLAAMWRTGPAAIDPQVKSFLGFAPDQHLIAFLYIGYPLAAAAQAARPTFEDRTVWMDAAETPSKLD